MKRLLPFLIGLFLAGSAYGQARIDQLGAAAAVGDTNVVPICQGCGSAVNAVGATGTQLTSYFATKFFSIANNLSEISGSLTNKASSRVNLGIPAGTSTTLYHGCTPNCDATFSALATGDIANNAVTYAKMQQVTAGPRILGNSTGSLANVGEIPFSSRIVIANGNLDIGTSSITNTYLGATAASDNLGAPTHDLSGPSYLAPIVAKVNGVAVPTTPNATDYFLVTTSPTALSYKQIPACGFVGYTANPTTSFVCNTQPNLSLTASNPGFLCSSSPITITSGNINCAPNFPVQTTTKTASYELVDSHSGGATDAFTSIKFNGSNLTAGINSSSASYFPSGFAVVLVNENATNLNVCIGSTTACTLGGSSTFDGPGGIGLTSFNLGQWCWAWIQADAATSPNNYHVQSGCYGSGGGGGSGALTKISTQTASNSATLQFTSLPTTYNTIFVDCNGIVPATSNVDLWMEYGEGATPTWVGGAASHFNYTTFINNNGTQTVLNSGATGAIVLTNADLDSVGGDQKSLSLRFYISNITSTTIVKNVSYQVTYGSAGTQDHESGTGGGAYYADANAITAIRFLMSSGNITSGQCTAYGLQS